MQTTMKSRTIIYSALCLILASGPARASDVPNHIAAAIPNAHLAGAGKLKWFGLTVYEAQFWVGRQGFYSEQPVANPFALDLRYAHSIPGKKIARAGIEQIEKLGFGSEQQHQQWLMQMETCFPDVEDGTHITGMYSPDRGSSFFRDGKLLCEIADKEFSRAFFAIWLDPRTNVPDLREALLKKALPE